MVRLLDMEAIIKSMFPSLTTLISTVASLLATVVFLRSNALTLIPPEIRRSLLTKFRTFFFDEVTLSIDEYEGLNKNHLFDASALYMDTIINPSTNRFRASIPEEKETKIHVSVSGNQDLIDKFQGFQLRWRMVHKASRQTRYINRSEDDYASSVAADYKFIELTFRKKHKNKVFEEYLPYVMEKSRAVKEDKKILCLHTLKHESKYGRKSTNPWQSVKLDHPSTFDTLAMDEKMKTMVIDDLNMFLKRKEIYRKVGKAWKRGYLLFGPPGTGKSSLIAAMANYLKFDVYDLELTDVERNSDLRRLLISTANRSILVVEDIDASIDLSRGKPSAPKKTHTDDEQKKAKKPRVTLSGFLNFIDGLWSSCGDERIVIFTTNHIEKLDPALLRPGRMDVHINMSYCTPFGFKMLVSNYLTITDDQLLFEAEKLVGSTRVTPAEVGEQLLKSDDSEQALRGLIEFLEKKKESETVEIEVVANDVVEENEIEAWLEGLIKMSKEYPEKLKELVLKHQQATNALKMLMGFSGGNGNENHKEDDDANRA